MQTSDELQLAFMAMCTEIPTTLTADEASSIIDEINILKALLMLHVHRAANVE